MEPLGFVFVQESFEALRNIFTETFNQFAAKRLRQLQCPRRGMNKPAQRIPRVIEQALADRHRIKGQRKSVDQRMPAVRPCVFNRPQVALCHSLVPKRAEPSKLPPPDALAGGSKI